MDENNYYLEIKLSVSEIKKEAIEFELRLRNQITWDFLHLDLQDIFMFNL